MLVKILHPSMHKRRIASCVINNVLVKDAMLVSGPSAPGCWYILHNNDSDYCGGHPYPGREALGFSRSWFFVGSMYGCGYGDVKDIVLAVQLCPKEAL